MHRFSIKNSLLITTRRLEAKSTSKRDDGAIREVFALAHSLRLYYFCCCRCCIFRALKYVGFCSSYVWLTHRFPSWRQLWQHAGLFSPGASARGQSTRGIGSRGGITMHAWGNTFVMKAASDSMLLRRRSGSSLLRLHSVGVDGII